MSIQQIVDEAAAWDERRGYCEAMDVVGEIVRKLQESGDSESSKLIHEKVWCQLRDQRDARAPKPTAR